MDLEEIKQKMFEKLKPSGWDMFFKSYIFSSQFTDVLNKLYELSSSDKRFTPPLKDLFRAFEECPYDKLQVVIVGQDPYPHFDQADGISFSCSKTGKLQPSLRYIFDEINRTIYGGNKVCTDVDLKRWSNQGILMLNTALTTEVGKIGQHYDIWNDFTAHLFDYLNHNKQEIIYIYMGKKAQGWADLVSDDNHKIFVSHPASAAYTRQKEWNSDNAFLKVQQAVAQKTGNIINW